MAPHPLQYSCLENPMDRRGWQAAVHGVAKSRTQLSDFTFHFSLSCIGEENGNPLQCSCLENPRDRGAWWAAISKVAQSRTRLKQLSSSSSSLFSQVISSFLIPFLLLSYFHLNYLSHTLYKLCTILCLLNQNQALVFIYFGIS